MELEGTCKSYRYWYQGLPYYVYAQYTPLVVSVTTQSGSGFTPLFEETNISAYPECSDISLSYIHVTVDDRDTLTQNTKQLQDLLLAVTANLSEHSRLEERVAFFN